MNALKAVKILSVVFYLLYLLFYSFESHGYTLRYAARVPASFVSGDRIDPLLVKKTVWLQGVFVADDAGVLEEVKKDFDQWQKTENYKRAWNLQSTGLYKTPDSAFKKKYFQRRLLKYADKRLSGEIKNSEEGSALHRIKTVEKTLSPKAEAKIAPNIRLKFKARVLQGQGSLMVNNPYVDYRTDIHTSGQVDMHLGKKIGSLGIHAKIDYDLNQKQYIAALDKNITKNIKTTISSAQSDSSIPFNVKSDKTLRISYTAKFP